MSLSKLRADIRAETDKIWLDEPYEIKSMRLGIFPSGSGTRGQYFTNLVFINGDMRALSTWITPGVVLRAVEDDSFTLEQAKNLFKWINVVSVDFLAYTGFVNFSEFVHRIIACYDEIETKDQFRELLVDWYAYANRMYLWVHHMFPWALGTAFPKPSSADLDFMVEANRNPAVAKHFEKYGQQLVDYASELKD